MEFRTLNSTISNTTRTLKPQRIQWFGQIQRIEDSRMQKRIQNAKVYNTRRSGKPKLIWIWQCRGWSPHCRIVFQVKWQTALEVHCWEGQDPHRAVVPFHSWVRNPFHFDSKLFTNPSQIKCVAKRYWTSISFRYWFFFLVSKVQLWTGMFLDKKYRTLPL